MSGNSWQKTKTWINEHRYGLAGALGFLSAVSYLAVLIVNLCGNAFSYIPNWWLVVLFLGLLPLMILIFSVRIIFRQYAGKRTKATLKTQLSMIRAIFSITLGFLAFAALFGGEVANYVPDSVEYIEAVLPADEEKFPVSQVKDDEDMLQEILEQLLVLSAAFTVPYYASLHQLHRMEDEA